MSSVKRQRPGITARLSGLDTDIDTSFSEGEPSEMRAHPNVYSDNNFMYMELFLGSRPVISLLDSGSSINVMAKNVFDSLSPSLVSEINQTSDSVVIANGHSVDVWGTARVKICLSPSRQPTYILVHILHSATHPLILGTDYLKSNKIVLDFGTKSCFTQVKKTTKIRCKDTFTIAPNSECIVIGKLSKDLPLGMQGLCVGHAELTHKGLMVARSVLSCLVDRVVPVKVLNPGYETVHVNKGTILATFKLCDNTVDLLPVSCNHIQLQQQTEVQTNISQERGCIETETLSDPDFVKFQSYFDVNPELSDLEKSNLFQCLYEHKEVFITDENPGLGLTHVVKHHIQLKPDFQPKHQRPYRLPPDKKQVLKHQLDELLAQGIIAPVSETEELPITSPIVLVAKRNKPKVDPNNITREQSLSSYRFCCDFRYLNTQTLNFRYTIPDLQDLTESFSERQPNYMTTLDLSSGFFQMEISDDSTKYTAFNTCYGTYKFLRLPQGLQTSPNSFQLLMDRIFNSLTFMSVLCYLDDILIFSESFEQHLKDLREVLTRLAQAGLKLKPRPKCKFAESKCIFLGHEISNTGIRPPSDRIELLRDYPTPTNRKELQRALGLFNWFRKFIPNYSATASPLYSLLKRGVSFKWSTACADSFQCLKTSLCESEALAFPKFDLEFRLQVDTSSKGIGYMLYQMHDKESPRVVRFGSKGLSKWQQSYGPTKLELLGVVTSVLDCASYLRGRHFLVECDHQALKPLFQKQLKGAIYERWLAILQQFDFDITYKPARQVAVPDALSRREPFQEILLSSPEEDDPYFQYVPEKLTQIRIADSHGLTFHPVNNVQVHRLLDNDMYDADTEDNIEPFCCVRTHVSKLKNNAELPTSFFSKYLIKSKEEANGSVTSFVRPDNDFQSPTDDPQPTIQSRTDDPLATIQSQTDDPLATIQSQTDDPQATIQSQTDDPQATIQSQTDDPQVTIQSQTDDPQVSMQSQTDDPQATIQSQTDDPQATIQSRTDKSQIDIQSQQTDDNMTNIDIVPVPTPYQVDTVQDETDANIVQDDLVSYTSISQYDSQTDRDADSGFDMNSIPALQKIDLTPECIRNYQDQDKQFHPIIEYLSSGTLPKSQKKARLVLLQQADYALINNMLFHSRVAKTKRTKVWSNFQLVLPNSLILTVLKLFHDSTLGAHGGIQDTIDRIREHFYFPRLATVVSDYVKSCHDCQARKVTKVLRQNTIVAYPTPSAPFAVWEVDLYGPIPITAQGSTYIFTALDMFSRFLYAVALPRKDAVTVAEALFRLFTTFGVCDTLVSDCGSEFTAAVTQELCRLLQIPQQFTPSFVHHCLGACERVHATLAARLTPFMNKDCNNWDVFLPSVVFAINNAVNSGTGYSPFEVLYGQRPKFPLASHSHSFKSLPADTTEYMTSKAQSLSVIRSNISENLEKSKTAMLNRANQGKDILKLAPGDYVYLADESNVAARKLRHQCAGPYVVDEVVSPHMITLIDPEGQKQFSKPIHLDRVKPAYVRQETPGNFFIVTKRREKPITVSVFTQTDPSNIQDTSVPDRTQIQDRPVSTRPRRTIQRPIRFRDNDHISPDQISLSDSDGSRKIKRILAQRHISDGIQYLIQQVGEPAQNAVWISHSDLNARAKQHVITRPPPLV